jgi:transcription elongation factor GreA
MILVEANEKEEKYLTLEGYQALLSELEELEKKRKEVSRRIKEAVDFGDLSENSEYTDAKEEQAFIEGRIAAVKAAISGVKIIEESPGKEDEVTLGREVYLEKVGTGERCCFRIVGSEEADPSRGKISYQSPVGKALLGRKVGEEVLVETPAGKVRYLVLAVRLSQ